MAKEILNKIHGETAMGWTCFVAEMNDVQKFNFGTGFSLEFFDLPDGYSYTDIKKTHSGKSYVETEGIVSYRLFIKSRI